MPRYIWRCDHCGAVVEVQRSVDEYDVPPTKEEKAPAASLTIGGDCEWKKIITSTPVMFEQAYDTGVLERTHRHPNL